MPLENDQNGPMTDLPVIGSAGGAEGAGKTERIAPLAAPDADSDLSAGDAEIYDKLKERRRERRRRKIRRRAIIAVVAAAVIALAALGVSLLTQKPSAAPEAVTDVAMRGTYTTTVSASGTLEPLSSTVITPEITGTIAEVRVSAGQTVKKGDTVLVIKNDELDRAIEAARRELRDAQNALESAREQEAEAEAAYYADETGTVDVSSVNQLVDAVNTASSAVEKAQDAYDQAVAEGAKRTVTAPLDGSVVAMNAQVGASVGGASQMQGASSGPLIQIADLTQMKVTVQVEEESISKIAQDQEATIGFQAFPDLSLNGRVVGIASVSTSSGDAMSAYQGGGSSSATFAVDVLIPEPDPRLKPGMTASVSLTTEKIDDVIMVPVTALQTDDGTSYYVNVETDPETHATERREVTVIAQNDSLAVVGKPADSAVDMPESPLEDGEVLVISGGAGTEAGAASPEMYDAESGGGAA